jgi:proline racemase
MDMWHITDPVRTIDYHTAGEPFRIVLDEIVIPGTTVAEKRITAIGSADVQALRRFLCTEPRGHADMYGCFIVPADAVAAADADAQARADFGALFWHGDGFSTACGHGTIALGVWAIESGLITAKPDGVTTVTIDVPSGRVAAHVRLVAGEIVSVSFENVESYVLHRDVPVETSVGTVLVDVSFGGALYASVQAGALGLSIEPEQVNRLTELGAEIKWLLNDTEFARHPTDDRLSGIYGTIIYDELPDRPEGPHQRNVTVFADGRVDRSPCGSGTAARLALLVDAGLLAQDQVLTHDSIIGSRFIGSFRPAGSAGPAGPAGPAIIPTVEGMAYKTGEHTFTANPADPLKNGFDL